MLYTHTNENDEEFIWDVDYTHSPHIPTGFYGSPEQWHGGDNSETEVNSVINSEGVDITQMLDEKTIGEIKEACIEDMETSDEY